MEKTCRKKPIFKIGDRVECTFSDAKGHRGEVDEVIKFPWASGISTDFGYRVRFDDPRPQWLGPVNEIYLITEGGAVRTWMKWESTERIMFNFKQGSWETPLGKVTLATTTGGETIVEVPGRGRFILTHEEMFRGLAELLPELREENPDWRKAEEEA